MSSEALWDPFWVVFGPPCLQIMHISYDRFFARSDDGRTTSFAPGTCPLVIVHVWQSARICNCVNLFVCICICVCVCLCVPVCMRALACECVWWPACAHGLDVDVNVCICILFRLYASSVRVFCSGFCLRVCMKLASIILGLCPSGYV